VEINRFPNTQVIRKLRKMRKLRTPTNVMFRMFRIWGSPRARGTRQIAEVALRGGRTDAAGRPGL